MKSLSTSTALELVQQHWHLSGAISELPSYADRNFKIDTEQASYVFKVANPNWSYADLDIENEALLHLAKTCPELALPKIFLSEDGRHIIPLTLTNDQGEKLACHMRLLSFVDGEVYAEAAQKANTDLQTLEYSLGLAIAKLDRGLSDFTHPAMHREVDWSISMLPSLEDQIAYVDDDEIRSLVTHHTAYFTQHEQAWKQQLPLAIIHNDANDYNVIVAPDPHQAGHYHVNAIIDFGDMCYHLRVVDLAITIVYALQHAESLERVQECIATILEAYQTTHRLNAEELRILPALIQARLSQSVLMATRAYRKNPENEYILISQKGVRRLLRQFAELGDDRLQQLVLRFQ